MKRKTKILVALLSVLLVSAALLSAILVSAAEEVKGVTVKSTQNFENVELDWYTTASSGANPKAGSVTFIINGRGGVVSAGSSLPYEDNRYAVITQDNKVGSQGPYVCASAGAYPTKELLNNSTYDMSKHSYYSFDIDVMAPSGKFIEASIDFSPRYINASGSNAIWSNSALSNVVKFGNDSTGSYIYINGDGTKKQYVNPYDFTHITCIVEPVVTSSSYNANTYVYINGEYFNYKAGTSGNASFYNGVQHVSLLEYRINWSTTNYPDRTFAFDNPTFRIYDKTYDGNLSSVIAAKTNLDAWESNLYDESAMPIGKFEAYNETTRARYSTIAEAISAANAGDVIHIVRDVAEPVTLSKDISISTSNGLGGYYNISISTAEGYSLVPTLNGVYKCEKTVEKLYEYVSGGATATADRTKTFAEVVSLADKGTTIKLFDSVYVDADTAIGLSKNLTVDLGGNTIVCKQANKVCFMNVNTGYTLTLKNGTLVAEYDAVGKANVSYPAFGMGSRATINLEGVNTYSPGLIWSYGGIDTKVNIVGGIHHQYGRLADASGGIVETRTNTTFTATGATFIFDSGTRGLFSSLHYKTPAGTARKSTFTYNNCKIYGETPAQSILGYANEHTEVYFNGCDIVGSIHPSYHEWDTTQNSVVSMPAKDGSIVLGEGCRIGSGASFSSAVRTASGYSLSENYKEEKTTLYKQSGAIATSDFKIVEEEFSMRYLYAVSTVTSYNVTWYAADGKTVLKTESVAPGAEAIPPEYNSDITNGWYTASYDGWSDTVGGSKLTSFKIDYDRSFYPAFSGTLIPDLNGAGYNLSFLGSVKVNLYLPTVPRGLTFNGVFDADGNEIFKTKVILRGEECLRFELGEVAATSLTSSIGATVKFSVNGVEYEKSLSLSPYKYANTLLLDSANEERAYSVKSYQLVMDMLRYSNNLVKYIKYAQTGSASGNAYLTRLLNTYSKYSTALPEDFSDLSEVDMSGLYGYVSSFTFDVTSYQPAYKITFSEGSKIVDCYAKMNGYYVSAVNGANYGEITYKASGKTYFEGSEYLASVDIGNIPMYNADNTVEITVLLENGMEKSGRYNLNGYYNQVTVSDASQEELLRDFVKALRAFSDSAAEYKFDTVIIPESEAIDFRNCDHPNTVETTIKLTEGILPLTAISRYCDKCKNHLVYYSDYGTVGDGVANEFVAVRRAHTAANAIKSKFPTYTVTVVSGEGTFYFGAPDDSGLAAIPVLTNVDWDGAHFIIDDTVIDIDGAGYSAAKQAIFVLSSSNPRGYSVTAKMPNGVPAGATNIGYAPGEPTMILLYNYSVRHYIRYGINENGGAVQQEIILVDAYGNVDPTTPVEWDYTNVLYCTYGCTYTDENSDSKCDTCNKSRSSSFSATAYSAADEPILISGLDKDGNINCIWETRTNEDVSLETYNQFVRNISVRRSNTTIEGIDRVFVEDNTNDTPRQTYAGYISVSYSYNTVIKDMLVNNHLSHYQTNGALLGSYDFGGNTSINTSWINCKIKNFFPSNGKVTYRGMFGTNYMRNSYLEGCVLTSFDSHSGAYNVTIENSTFEHINYVGGGEVIMRNVTVYVDGGYAACILRQDYGSMWKGDLKMDNITLRHDGSYSKEYIDIVKAFYTNWYFGYTSHLPGKIYVNNAKIEQYTRTSAEYEMGYGTIVEENISKSNKKLGIHQNINSQLTKDYDYSTANKNNLNPKVCTTAVYITNTDLEIMYPDHWYFEDMKVYIDGVEQDWFKLRSGLHSHSDASGDKNCDVCGKYRG